MNPTTGVVYTPPRPNLGPEPWVESTPWMAILIAIGLALSVAFFWKRRRPQPSPTSTSETQRTPTSESDSPRERIIAWSTSLRESLANAFGPAWLAKTTEEIANEPPLIASLGPEPTARLIAFLAAADRTKFADSLDPVAMDLTESSLRELTELIATANSIPTRT